MVQYTLKQPKTLETLAVRRLAYYIALQAEDFIVPFNELSRHDASKTRSPLSQRIEDIRKSLQRNVPGELHDNLMFETMAAVGSRYHLLLKQGDPRQQHVLGRMVETLFNNNITFISLAAEDLCIPSFCNKSYMLTNVQELNISAGQDSFEFAPHFYAEIEISKMLKGLPELKTLVMNYCSINVVRCLVKNCKLLEVIKLSRPINGLNDRMINILTGLSNLKIIDLEDSQVTQKGVEALLMSCKNIISIKNTPFIANALENIALKTGNTEKRFQLKAFKNYSETTQKQLQLVTQMCPLLEKLHLEVYTPNESLPSNDRCPNIRSLITGSKVSHTRYNFKVINSLNNLQLLIIKKYNFYSDNIKKILQAKGHHLVDLVLDVYDVDLHALKSIIKTCPNLKSLTINTLEHPEESRPSILRSSLKHTSDFFTDLILNEKEMPPPLKQLKSLSLNVEINEPMDDQFVILLLSTCPNIEYIEVGYQIWITQDIMIRVLNENPLVHLKEFKMWGSSISESQINQILQNCVNRPTIIIRARIQARNCIPVIVKNVPVERPNQKTGAYISIQRGNVTSLRATLQYVKPSPV